MVGGRNINKVSSQDNEKRHIGDWKYNHFKLHKNMHVEYHSFCHLMKQFSPKLNLSLTSEISEYLHVVMQFSSAGAKTL